MDLFSRDPDSQPLAARMRPETLEDLVGQEEILGPGRLLRRAIKSDQLSSLIFYGPPGTGKTTLARIIANTTKSHFISLNAVLSGIKQVKEAIEKAQDFHRFQGRKTLLFVDEVHRWNKAQQDALLPWVENGTIILIGATTENPFFEVNSALVSRSRIFQLKPLREEHLLEIGKRAVSDKIRGYGQWKVLFEPEALEHLVRVSDGDARTLLNALQLAVETTPEQFPPPEGTEILITRETAEESIQKRAVLYDRDGDYHFDTISAFIKSIRGSDPDAALYWLALMVRAGEDPSFLFRRMLISAAEDVGLADPQALGIVTAAAQAFERTGFPEGTFFLTHAALYLATAPKSNSSLGFFDAMKAVENEGGTSVPVHLRDASRDAPLGHGAGYQYPHSFRNHWVSQQYLPTTLRERIFYHPGAEGYENQIRDHVLSRRECQLTAAFTDTDEELSFGPKNSQRENWLRRTEGEMSSFLKTARDRLFSFTPIKRTDRILVLEETTGLLTLEACRKAPEGGVYTLMRRGVSPDIVETLTNGWPEPEKPVLTTPDNLENFKALLNQDKISFNLITGIFGSLKTLISATPVFFPFLSPTGQLAFMVPLPGAGTRPGDLLPSGILQDEALALYQKWEKSAYAAASSLSTEMEQYLSSNSHGILFHQEEIDKTEEIFLSEERISHWFPENPEQNLLWMNLVSDSNPTYINLRTLFLEQLKDTKKSRIRKFLMIYGTIENK